MGPVASATTGGLPDLDLPGLGVAGTVVLIVLRIWWLERADRIAAQAALVALTERVVAVTTEMAGSTAATAAAVDRLAEEVRRR